MKIDIDFETLDRLTVATLYESYENLYYLYYKLLNENTHPEDRLRAEELMDAITILAGYFERPGVALEKLAKIERDVNARMDLEVYEDMLKNMGGTDGI